MKAKNSLTGKALKPNAGIAADFASPILELITLMHRDIKRELEACFKENSFDHAMDGSITSQARIILNALVAKWQDRFNKAGVKLSKKMVSRTVASADIAVKMSIKDMSEKLTIDTTFTNLMLKDVIKASTLEAANLIKLIPQKYLSDVQGQVMRSITNGKGLADLVPYLTSKYQGNVRHAKNVALDQTRKSFQAVSTSKLKAFGIKSFIWIHSGGGKEPRKLHKELNGKEYQYDNPPYIGDMYGNRIYGMPAEMPNCLPYSSNIESFNGLNKLFRRRFRGELTTIITESGKTIESTPNHPVLTNRGWIACDDVQIGDYVVNTQLESVNIVKADINNDKTVIGKLFDSAFSLFGSEISKSSSSAFEFHGDISDGEIDIVNIGCNLPIEWDVSFCKNISEIILSFANEHRNDFIGFSDSFGDEFLVRNLNANSSDIRLFSSLLSFFKSHSAHANDVRLALIAYIAARLNKPSPNDIARNFELISQFEFANALVVKGDYLFNRQLYRICVNAFNDSLNHKSISADSLGEVIGIDFKNFSNINNGASSVKQFERVSNKLRGEFENHVYNLETDKNWYSTNDLIIHNCRCITKPIFNFNKDKDNE